MSYEYDQLTFDDAFTARQVAIARADHNAAPDWKRAAREAVAWCASHHETFTADDVLARLAAVQAPTTHEPSALGPVMLAASRAGTIVKTGELRPSRLARRHRDLTVWSASAPDHRSSGTVPPPRTPRRGDQPRR